jgi:tetratricopeptide (TPR) repeat protein
MGLCTWFQRVFSAKPKGAASGLPEASELFHVRQDGDVMVVSFTRRSICSEPDVGSIRAGLISLVNEGRAQKLLVDCSGVETVSPAFLGTLVCVHQNCTIHQTCLIVCGIEPEIREIFSIAKLDRVLEIHGRVEEAIQAFGKSQAENRQEGEKQDGFAGAYLKGALALEKGDLDQALRGLEQATRRHPDDACSWEMLGCTLEKLGRYEEALRAFERVHQLGHECPQCWFNTWIAYRELRRAREGAKALDRSLELKADNPVAWYERGLLLGMSYYTPDEPEAFDGRHEQAVEAFDKVIELEPNHPGAWYHKGYVLYKLSPSGLAHQRAIAARGSAPDFVQQALICLDRAIALEPGRTEARELKEEVLAWQKETKTEKGT